MVHVIDLNFQNTKESIAAFLMETSIGPILFETGPFSTFNTLKSEIEKLGFKVSDIKHVFISHIHFDHAGAAWKFAEHGAHIYVHPLGLQHLNNPERLWGSAVRIYGAAMEKLWGKMEPISLDQLIPLPHLSQTILDDINIQALHTLGHAIHHLAFAVNNMLFGGDVAGVRIGTGPVVPPCPPPDIHIEDWLSSIDLIRKLSPEKLYLTHFGLVNSTIEEHLNNLESTLIKYADWILKEMEKEKEISKIIDSFQSMTEQKWVELNMTEQDILRYSLANPAFMSVNGLIRYWTKIKGIEWI
jgi:glyoxylase-like metal-dependent hydrolase (beta-lactamase superfamily II)